MSAIKNLIQMVVAGYGRHIPLRDFYYQIGHGCIVSKLNKRADTVFDSGDLLAKLASITGIPDVLDIDAQEKERIIASADKTVECIFNLLGSGEKKLIPIPWSTDFISGYEWKPGTYYRKYNQVDLSNNADVKVPREISRCHHLLHIALSYRFTKDEKYAQTCIEHILDWIDENPLMYSINWGCAMDVGIRAVNWIWALSLLSGVHVSKEDEQKISRSLYQHGWFIYRNLEGLNWGYNNNHYFADIVGLLHIALLFKENKEGGEWLKFANSTFFREARLQILPSGMLYEGSTNYHRLAAEMVLTTVILLDRNGMDVPPDIMGRLENMMVFIMKLTMPDGTMPVIGDQDNGRILPWGVEELNDHRYLLSVGAILFKRGDMKHYSSGYNIYVSIFGGTKEMFDDIKDYAIKIDSTLFRDAGFALMRKDDNYLLFNTDNQGMYRDTGTAMSHTHCDWFSFVLCYKGVTFIVDPGSYVYSSDARARNFFRSTQMHNTVVIDDENQEKMPGKMLWDYKRKTTPRLIEWYSDEHKDIIDCEHDGYSWLGDNIKHRRKVFFDKQNISWVIHDAVEAEKYHDIAVYYHLDAGVEVHVDENHAILKTQKENLHLGWETENSVDVSVIDGQVSKGYGMRLDAKILVIKSNTNTIDITVNIWGKRD